MDRRGFIKAAGLVAGSTLFAPRIFGKGIISNFGNIPVYANSKLILGPNNPIGIAKGIFPGRVVWIWNPEATNENCTNAFGDGWFMDKNTNMSVVGNMAADAVMNLTGKTSVADSWDALFRYFNNNHGKGDIGYKDGEKIYIRTNQVSASGGTYDPTTFAVLNQKRYGMAETSPQIVLSILRQLVYECGVKQGNIAIGDPMKHMYKHVFDMWHNEFPNVIYVDSDARLGRTAPVKPAQPSIYYSDRGKILETNGTSGSPVLSDYFPTQITGANYIIVVPALKAHARGGVTLTAKIHFGSNLAGSATHLHGGLVAPNKENNNPMRTDYGMYRVQVDLMSSKYLGANTVLFVVDGLWGGSEANDPPRKFQMPPFNNGWTSSVFVSQDHVAIESVCFDFLKAEYTEDRVPFYGDYPQMPGADDYINQAADSTYWPSNFIYDPDKTGGPIASLGVCEHWNNPVDKQYTRNLNTGSGIELLFYKNNATAVIDEQGGAPDELILLRNYPNPFNPVTTISFKTANHGYAVLKIYDILGHELKTLFNRTVESGRNYDVKFDASGLASGVYICRLDLGNSSYTRKLVYLK